MKSRPLNEPELADDYPIHAGYFYVVDGKVYQSDFHGITAEKLKRHLKASKITRCDAVGRDLF